MKSSDYRNLIVWQKSLKLVAEIYNLTSQFPKEEIYGLSSQIKRASISMPSNIAEVSKRGTKKDFRHFLMIAYGSGAELETQIEIAKILPFGKNLNYTEVEKLLTEVMKMLNKMIYNFRD